MAEERRRDNWSMTSAVLAMIANTARDPKKKASPYKASDFDPFNRKGSDEVIPADISVLKTVFIDGKLPKEIADQ